MRRLEGEAIRVRIGRRAYEVLEAIAKMQGNTITAVAKLALYEWADNYELKELEKEKELFEALLIPPQAE